MRLYIKLSKNTIKIPYSYQHLLTGTIHKWIGKNNLEYGKKSLYSFSWLQHTKASPAGLDLTNKSYFFFSAYDSDLIKRIMEGIYNDPETFFGSKVTDFEIVHAPVFAKEERFFLASPLLIKERSGKYSKHLTFEDENFECLLTLSLKSKLRMVNIPDENLMIKLDRKYTVPKTKLVDYKGIKNKTTLAPLIISGTPEQIAFAWLVGLGNSTGAGFGAIK